MKQAILALALLCAHAAFGQGCTPNSMMDSSAGTATATVTTAALLSSIHNNNGMTVSFEGGDVGLITFQTAAHIPFLSPRVFCPNTPYTDSSTLGVQWNSSNGKDGMEFNMPGSGTGPTYSHVEKYETDISQNASGVNLDIGAYVAGGDFSGAIFFGTGTQLEIDIECESSITHGSSVPVPTGAPWSIAYLYQTGSAGANGHFVVVFDQYGALLGEQDCEAEAGTNTPSYFLDGVSNIAGTPPGGDHLYFGDHDDCYLTTSACTMLMDRAPYSNRVLDTPVTATNPTGTARSYDWTHSGIAGGIPSGSYTKCGSTVAAGTSAATITSDMAACSPNTYLLLGPGNFNWNTGQGTLPTSGNVVLRGSGGDPTNCTTSTCINFTGTGVTCGQFAAVICGVSSDGSFTTGPPANTCNWTGGFTQFMDTVTLTNLAGNCPTSISASGHTLIFIDGCNTGYSGSACTGSAVDNLQWFVCADAYNSTGPVGCSSNGPDAGGSRPERDELEVHTATAVSGGTITLAEPLVSPNWAAVSNPQAWIVQPIVNIGVENMVINPSGAATQTSCIGFASAYEYWVSGVACVTPQNRAINEFQSVHGIIQNSYLYKTTGSGASIYGIRLAASCFNLIQNNLFQQIPSGPFFNDGSSCANVIAYNFSVDSLNAGDLIPSANEHAVNLFDEFEQNIFQGSIFGDDNHGTNNFRTDFRNFNTGWASDPPSGPTTYLNSIADYAYARYNNHVSNVLCTSQYHTIYSAANSNLACYWEGGGATVPISVPTDSLVKTTGFFYGDYNTVQATNRFCSTSANTGWSSTCSSASEIPTGASTYPSLPPQLGDVTAGQGPFPPSFINPSKPSFFGSVSWPAIGSGVTGGNVGNCTGTINTPGEFAGVPATNSSQCTGTTLQTGWNGEVNAIPAMLGALAAGMPPDGTGSVLAFNSTNFPYLTPSSGPTTTPAPCVLCFAKLTSKLRGIYEKAFLGDRRVAASRGSAVARANNGS